MAFNRRTDGSQALQKTVYFESDWQLIGYLRVFVFAWKGEGWMEEVGFGRGEGESLEWGLGGREVFGLT